MVNYELFARQLKWPTDWSQVYGRQAPLIVEIGFGGGQFLRDLAQTRPEVNVLGVEISLPSIRRGVQKLSVAGLGNGRVVQTTADYLLWACCEPATIAEVYINFPDPWPKKGQKHRRLINGRFLELLASRMKPEAKLEIATDHADYAETITACLEETAYFSSRLATPFVTEDKERLRTKYEMIGLSEGRVCHYYKWQRNHKQTVNRYTNPRETPMPHVVVKTPVSLNKMEAQFTLKHVEDNERHVNFMAIFQNKERNGLLIETYVKEEPLAQRIGITIRQRAEDVYVIGLSEIGFPRPTEGLQFAIATLAKWLLSLADASELMSQNLSEGLLT